MIGWHALVLVIAAGTAGLPASLAAQDGLPTLTLDRVLTIPGEGDGYYLSTVVDVLPAPDGTLVVREGAPEIGLKVFGSDGRFLHRIGREGEGPGEYLRIESSSLRISFDDHRMILANPYKATTLTIRAPDGSGVGWIQRLRPQADATASYRVLLWRDGEAWDRTFTYEPRPLADRERRWHERIVEAVATGVSGRSGRSALEIRRVVEDEIRVPDFALPVDEEVLAIAYGKVFTRWKDEWDVPEVRVYRVLENDGR